MARMKVCVTVDMDNYAEYRRLLDPGGDVRGPTFYEAIPRFLDMFERHGVRATFFMVGRDATVPDHRRRVREIFDCGHEVANHSWSHPYNFRQLDRSAREQEIARAEDAIGEITGQRPVGFRTPSGDLDTATLELLAERGYEYESCIFPTPVIWAFMLYGKLFIREPGYALGQMSAALAPPRPFLPSRELLHREAVNGDAPPIIEIPISVAPGLRLPFYTTLLRLLGRRVFDALVRSYGRDRRVLHLIMHLIDLVDFEDSSLAEAIASSPGLGVPFAKRERFVAHVMQRLAQIGDPVPLRELAREVRAELGIA